MRATATVLGFGLLCMSLPVAAQAAPADKTAPAKSESTKSESTKSGSTKAESTKSEARVGSLAPDEARRAERARRRAAEKNAKAAARETDHKMLEGKSVAAPETATSTDKNSPATAVMPAAPARRTATQAPGAPDKVAPVKVAPVKAAVAPVAAPRPRDALAKEDGRARDKTDVERSRSAERDARGHDRHDRRYASRRRPHHERLATDGSYRRAAPEEVIVEDGPPVALPPGAPPYPLPARGAREVYVVREVPPPPPGYAGYGPRPFYSVRVPGFARGPDDDVE